MGNLRCSYKINNLKENYNPNDYIEGTFYIENNDEKDKLIRSAEIQLIESLNRRTIQQYIISRGDQLNSSDVKEYPFKFRLGRWIPKKKMSLTLAFKVKTGVTLTLGSDKKSAIFHLPIQGSIFNNDQLKSPETFTSNKKSEELKSCTECGNKFKREIKFCEFCGKKI